jgi:FkbM family methyltransferase
MPASFARRLLETTACDACRRAVGKLESAVAFGLLRLLTPDRYRLVRPRGMAFRMYLNLRESPMMIQRLRGTYEPRKTRFFLHQVQPGMTVVDVGVNKGYFTLAAASALQGSGTVLAFEPSPENCEWIRRSIAANGFDNVRLFETALSDAAGRTELRLGKTSGTHSIVEAGYMRSGESLTVATKTLDSVLAAQGIHEVHVMKIDVEGAEALVLQGAANLLRRATRLTLAVDIHPQYGVDPESIVQILEDYGFQVRSITGAPLTAIERKSACEILATKG